MVGEKTLEAVSMSHNEKNNNSDLGVSHAILISFPKERN